MSKRIGVVSIIIENREQSAARVNSILSDYGHLVVGRMGIPYRERNLAVIALIVDGTSDDIGALTGKLGNIPGVSVRSVMSRKDLGSGSA